MIFVQNKSNNIRSRLGVALLSDNKQKTVISKPQEKRDSNPNINIFRDIKENEKEDQPIIKLNNPKESNKEKEKQMKDKFMNSGNNIFSLNKKSSSIKKSKKNYVVKLKNNMLFPINVPGCTPYDPYLINICKNAIIKVKDELPNYKEIIKKINTEFGIEEGNNLVELNSDNVGYDLKTLNTISNTKTTNFTQDKKNITHTEINTLTNFKNDTEGNIDINDIMPNPRKTLRKK
jgi:hypothetical protein